MRWALYGRAVLRRERPQIAQRKCNSELADTPDMSATRTQRPGSVSGPQDATTSEQPYTGPDRRRNPRHPHFVGATMQPADGNTDLNQAVLVCNLSIGGVGLLTDHPYAVDTVWRITLGNGPLYLNAKVR